MSWTSIGSAAANLGLDYFNTQAANNASRAAANRQMAFQERMSSTAHQRETKDLREAGLNPILSANAGASTPGGASYTANKAEMDIDPMLMPNLKQAKATTANTIQDTGLKAANTRSAEKSIEIANETKKLLMAQTAKEGEQARMSRKNADLLDKYGETSQIMGLIQSGTGSVGNLLGIGGAIKNLQNVLRPNKTITRENYSPRGEHMGTTSTRTYHD